MRDGERDLVVSHLHLVELRERIALAHLEQTRHSSEDSQCCYRCGEALQGSLSAVPIVDKKPI